MAQSARLLAKLRPHRAKLAVSALVPVLWAESFLLVEYRGNIAVVYPKEIIVPLVATALMGLVPLLIYRWLIKRPLAVMVASFIAAPALYVYQPRLDVLAPIVKALLPVSDDVAINLLVLVLLLSLCGLIGWASDHAVRKLRINPSSALQIFAVLIAYVFTYNAGGALVTSIRLLPQATTPKSAIAAQTVKPAATKPDIYYLVVEDYANNDSFKRFYNYDNQPFLDSLKQKGFVVKDDTYSNYPYTIDSIPSTLNMGYLTDPASKYKDAPRSELTMRAMFNHPAIVEALKKQGYWYGHVGSWWTVSRKVAAADVNYTEPFQLYGLGLSHTLSEFESLILRKSVFGSLLTHGLSWGQTRLLVMAQYTERSVAQYQFDTLTRLATSSKPGGRFIWGHLLIPHPPYVFNADGSQPLYSSGIDNVGLANAQKYVNQVEYTNTRLNQLISTIKTHAKTPPVIVLLSDEGPHPSEMGSAGAGDDDSKNFDLTKLSDAKLRQKYGTLAAYDMPGLSNEERARLDSPVNAFRVVLDHYFGYQLGNLPNCSFAFKEYAHWYDFIDVTARLHGGTEDARCRDIHK
jgi:TRAP-type C4-dicarboxylate transport system permease small subunit